MACTPDTGYLLRSSDVKAYLLPVVSLLRFCGMSKHGRTDTAQGYMMVGEQKNGNTYLKSSG